MMSETVIPEWKLACGCVNKCTGHDDQQPLQNKPLGWKERWKNFVTEHAAFEKSERVKGKPWPEIANITEYALDRIEAAEAKVAELERKVENREGRIAWLKSQTEADAELITKLKRERRSTL